ncbi:MAG: NAD(P)/FAD-dependent oxidoreductase [Spirochaetes bacterium]|nr:NAD(P)/FAD-dependent oxidoreductase [Spirochaetota bacterium]
MLEKKVNAVVIGGGSAGMAAALSIAEKGYQVAIIEREDTLGGILLQCIHNGFGLQEFKQELTGPEYAQRFEDFVHKNRKINIFLETTAVDITQNDNGTRVVNTYSKKHGVILFSADAVVLAMGCRERNRGNIAIAGTRPAGIFTAGLAQRLLNIDGFIPGKKVVIIGSGDIGLIMARRLTWVGTEVLGVVEIQPFPSGLTRNIVQCLNDFSIPLYLNHVVSRIYGKERVTKVRITPITQDGKIDEKKSFQIACDTILLSVGLIPDMELAKNAGVRINHDTNGPYVNADLMTSQEGIFACGNALHVHDIVDYVTEEARRCGSYVHDYIQGGRVKKQGNVIPGANIKYILPNHYVTHRNNRLYCRPMIVKNNAELFIKINKKFVLQKKLRHIQPSEMISIDLEKDVFKNIQKDQNHTLEVSIR